MRSGKTTAYDQNNNVQWYFHIFRAQKVQSSAKHRITFDEMDRRLRGLTMFAFNFGVEALELSVKLGLLVIFNFLGNCLL